MILLSNHLLTLPEFQKVEDVVIRINMAHVKDMKELKKFVDRDYDVFLDYPKGRSKPPVPSLSLTDAITSEEIPQGPHPPSRTNNLPVFFTDSVIIS